MKLRFLGNCGVYAYTPECGVLIDAPNGLHTVFDAVPELTMAQIAASEPPYDVLRAVCFTHKHSDHYDKKRLKSLLEQRPDLATFVPNGQTPQQGSEPFPGGCIRYFTAAHSGAEFAGVFHRVLLITIGSETLYVTGDADRTNPIHAEILQNEHPIAVFNPNFVSHEAGRALLPLCKKVFIYHMPELSEDTLGIARKCRTSFVRYADELKNVTLIEHYPTEVEA